MPALGRSHARPDVITDPLPRRVWLDAGEDVEACLEPGGDALGDLERLMEGALGAKDVVEGAPAALGGDIAVELHHGCSGSHGVRAIDLDLEVVLTRRRPGPYERGAQDEERESYQSRHHAGSLRHRTGGFEDLRRETQTVFVPRPFGVPIWSPFKCFLSPGSRRVAGREWAERGTGGEPRAPVGGSSGAFSKGASARPTRSRVADLRVAQDELSSSLPTGTRILSPGPRVIPLPATIDFFGSKRESVTVICDTEAPPADQDDPR